MGRISSCSGDEESAWFGNLKIMSLLFADDVLLLASSDYCDLQHTLGQFDAGLCSSRFCCSASECVCLNYIHRLAANARLG